MWVFLYALSGRLEFCHYGIVTAAGFYRWPKIETYNWSDNTDDSGNGRAVLNLTLRGRHLILPAIKIKVAQAKRPLPATGGGHTVIKSISAKQRPRRKSISAVRDRR